MIFRFPEDPNQMGFYFEFKEDDKETRIESIASAGDKDLNIALFNFTNDLGQGNTQPVHVGNINDRKLFLNFRVTSLKDKTLRSFHYTFYLEKI